MTIEEEVAWLRQKVGEQESELAELREHVKASVGKNMTLVECLRALAEGHKLSTDVRAEARRALRLAGELP